MKILIADVDIELIEDVLNLYLPDWELSIIDSGEKCLNILKKGSCPDIVILGMQLSDMSGFELTKHIRDYSDVPVIILSDDNDISALLKAFSAGVNDYIVKPFNNAVFIAKLKALIRRGTWDMLIREDISNRGIVEGVTDEVSQ